MSASKGGSWKSPPPVIIVSGSDDYLRSREIRRALQAAASAGRTVVPVPCGDSNALREALTADALYDQSWLVVLEGAQIRRKSSDEDEVGAWTEDDIALLAVHHQEGDASDFAILVHEPRDAGAKTFAGRLSAHEPKIKHIAFTAPKPWEAEAHGADFFRKEVANLDKEVAVALAEAMVRLVGTDLGVLSFEARKVCAFVDSEGKGRAEVTAADLRETVARLGTDDWNPLVDAVGAADQKKIGVALAEIRSGPLGARGPVVCCAVLCTHVVKWLRAAAILADGAPASEAASRLGIKDWTFQRQIAPPVTRWGVANLRNLYRHLVSAERGSKGSVHPWTGLEAHLLTACAEAGYRPTPSRTN